MRHYQQLSIYDLAWATDWHAHFGRVCPVIVEIGFGNGNYLVALAKNNPDHHVIGIEIASKSLEKAEKKVMTLGLDNVQIINGRGESALAHLFAPASVAQFHINYPDPWFKARHAERRFIKRDTLDLLADRLQVGGRLYLATDILDYAEMSDELLQATPTLTNLLPERWATHYPERLITTKYEAKGYREGRSGHYFVYERNATPAPVIPVIKELDMPHVVIATPLHAQDIVARHEKQTYNPEAGVYVMLQDVFLHQNNQAVLFEVMIEEPTIEQKLGIMLFPRDETHDGMRTYTVRYAGFGHPRMTRGLHHATRLLAEWVIAMHPQARIIGASLSV